MLNKLDKLINERLNVIMEKTILSSPDGTEKTLTGDQKVQATKAADNGDTVTIKKKGLAIKEDDQKVLDYINSVKSELDKLGSGNKIKDEIDNPKMKTSYKDFILKAFKINADPEKVAETLRDHWYGVYETKKNTLTEDGGGADPGTDDGNTGEPTDTGDQNDTVQHLYQIGLGFGGHLAKKKKKLTEDKKRSSVNKVLRYVENAEKHMNKVNEELKKAIEFENKVIQEDAEEDEKKTNKFSVQVRHELAKMLKDKNLVNSAMDKYASVMKMVKDHHDPKKIAKSILSTALKSKK